ncbi:MAG: hypothetical protein AABX32_06975 [Nanoarchaeota archaeon]
MAGPDLDGIAMSAEMLEASAAHLELQSLHAHYRHMIGSPREKELAVIILDAATAMREKYPLDFAGAGPDEIANMESDAQQVLRRVNGSAVHIRPPPYQTDSGIYLGNP